MDDDGRALAPSGVAAACDPTAVEVEVVNFTERTLDSLHLAAELETTFVPIALAEPIHPGQSVLVCAQYGDYHLYAVDVDTNEIVELPAATFQEGDPVILAE